MRYELIESSTGGWAVICDGVEVSRFVDHDQAMEDVADRLRGVGREMGAAFSVRFAAPATD